MINLTKTGKLKKLVFAFMILVYSDGPTALAIEIVEQNKCPGYFSGLKKYFKEVRDSRGLRIFVVDKPPGEDEKTALFGLFHEYKLSAGQSWIRWLLSPPYHTVQWPVRFVTLKFTGLPYQFTPVKAALDLPVRPLRWLVRYISGNKKTPTFVFELFFGVASSMGIYDYIVEPAWAEQLDLKIKASIEEHAHEYDQLIENDFRFKDIKIAFMRGEIDIKIARQSAFLKFAAYQSFYDLAQKDNFEPSTSRALLLKHVLFDDIRMVETRVLFSEPGFKYASTSPPDAQKIDQILRIRYLYLIQLQLIQTIVNNRSSLVELESTMEGAALIASIEKDEFSEFLFELHKRKAINTKQLIFRIQEDAFWRAKFMEWNILGIVRLKKKGDLFTDIALKLEDVRFETVNELKTLGSVRQNR